MGRFSTEECRGDLQPKLFGFCGVQPVVSDGNNRLNRLRPFFSDHTGSISDISVG